LRLADPSRALQTIQPLLEGDTRISRAHAIAGDAYAQMGQAREAIQQYASALQQTQQRLRALEADKSLEARKLDIAAYEAETKRISAETRETRLPAGLYEGG
jgi:lipopolysaccharide biosynthesis regulator YciM